jgi:hypothetical protein
MESSVIHDNSCCDPAKPASCCDESAALSRESSSSELIAPSLTPASVLPPRFTVLARLRWWLSFAGPAWLVSAAYIDPGSIVSGV